MWERSVKASGTFVCRWVMPYAQEGQNGRYQISVNGNVKATQDLYSQHDGMTNPYINLGECEPVNNAFEIRFELAGNNDNARARDGKYALGIDFFLLQNSLPAR